MSPSKQYLPNYIFTIANDKKYVAEKASGPKAVNQLKPGYVLHQDWMKQTKILEDGGELKKTIVKLVDFRLLMIKDPWCDEGFNSNQTLTFPQKGWPDRFHQFFFVAQDWH